MQLHHVNAGFQAPEEVLTDLARIETLWQSAWDMVGNDSGWLFGTYSLADVFYTPVAARIVGYNLGVSEKARSYCEHALSDPAVKHWRQEALGVTYSPFPYPDHPPIRDWPLNLS
jgi:glutathione S-transferase